MGGAERRALGELLSRISLGRVPQNSLNAKTRRRILDHRLKAAVSELSLRSEQHSRIRNRVRRSVGSFVHREYGRLPIASD